MIKLVIHPTEASKKDAIDQITAALDELTAAGEEICVIVGKEEEMISPQKAAEILGFSRQHVRRLIDAGELAAVQIPNSTHWQIPFSSVADELAERREQASERASLHEAGAVPMPHGGGDGNSTLNNL